MDIGILTVNPYLTDLQAEKKIENIISVLDYVDSKQMEALTKGVTGITTKIEKAPVVHTDAGVAEAMKLLESFKNAMDSGTTGSGQ